MHPAIRDHTDVPRSQDDYSLESGLACDPKNDTARQEFKNEADINYMLSKFNITQPRGTPIYGEWDDSLDLMTAFQSINDAKEAYEKLPDNLKAKFTRMEDLLNALNNGSLVIKDENAPEDAPPKAA